MNRFILLLGIALCSSASAQFLSFGVEGGVPLTDAYNSNGYSTSIYKRLYIVGPTVEVHLPFHLAIEADALYRRNGFAGSYTSDTAGPFFGPTLFTASTRVNDWQFPILGKLEVGHGPLRPFVDGGITYRHDSSTGAVDYVSPGAALTSEPFGVNNPNTAGISFGGGVALKLLLVTLEPEIRYTHWFEQPFTGTNLYAASSSNQADFLVGLRF